MRPAKVVLPVVAIVLIVVAISVRTCSPSPQVDQAEAVAIAVAHAGCPVVDSQVRFVRQSVKEQPSWVVGVKAADGRARTFLIDARDGAITRVESSP